MILVKDVKFFLRLFFSERGLDIMLNDLLDRKEGFLDDKILLYYSRKISIFPNGFTYDFSPKIKIPSNLFFFNED